MKAAFSAGGVWRRRGLVLFFLVFAGNAAAYSLSSQSNPVPVSGMWHHNLNDHSVPIVWKLAFDGNTTFTDKELRRIIGLESPSDYRKLRFWNTSGFEFDEIIMRGDAERVERYYHRRGFPHAVVIPVVDTGKKQCQKLVRFRIDEGHPAKIETVHYEYDAEPEALNDLRSQRGFQQAVRGHPMQQNRRYQLIEHGRVEHTLRTALHRAGYIHAAVRVVVRVDTTDLKAELTIKLTPGPLVYNGNILVEGNESASESFVLKRSGLQSGVRIEPDMLRKAEKHLSDYHLIRSARIQIRPEENDSIADLRIHIRELKPRSIRMQAGFSREKYLHTNVSWQHRHLLGSAHGLSSSVLGSAREQKIHLSYTIPHVLNHNTSLVLTPFAQRRDDPGWLIHRLGFRNQLIYKVDRHLHGRFGYERTWHRTSDQLKGHVSVLRFSADYAGPDSDWMLQAVAGFSGLAGSSALKYNRYSLTVQRRIRISSRRHMIVRQTSGLIDTADEVRLPGDLYFTSGGIGSVRGWMHQQLGPREAKMAETGEFLGFVPAGGRTLFEFSLEYVKKLHDRVDSGLFLDGGNVWRHLADVNAGEIRFGLGGGLRFEYLYNTELQIFIARKLNPSDTDLNIYDDKHYGNWTDVWGLHFNIDRAF